MCSKCLVFPLWFEDKRESAIESSEDLALNAMHPWVQIERIKINGRAEQKH